MVQKKRTVAAKSKAKKVVQPPVHRWTKWVLATVVVAILGFILSWLVAYNNVYAIGSSMVGVVFAVLGAFLVFYAGFVLLGKFGVWRVVLAFFATLATFLSTLTWGIFGTFVSSVFWPMGIPVKAGMWITPEASVLFASSFLLIASLATLLQAALSRQKHKPAVVFGLVAIAIISFLVILL